LKLIVICELTGNRSFSSQKILGIFIFRKIEENGRFLKRHFGDLLNHFILFLMSEGRGQRIVFPVRRRRRAAGQQQSREVHLTSLPTANTRQAGSGPAASRWPQLIGSQIWIFLFAQITRQLTQIWIIIFSFERKITWSRLVPSVECDHPKRESPFKKIKNKIDRKWRGKMNDGGSVTFPLPKREVKEK